MALPLASEWCSRCTKSLLHLGVRCGIAVVRRLLPRVGLRRKIRQQSINLGGDIARD